MKRRHRAFVLGVVLAFLWTVLPFRVLGLATETMFTHPGEGRYSQDDSRFWEAMQLESRLIALGWTIAYAPHPVDHDQEVLGLTFWQTRTILVDSNLHWSARAAVLAHEAGHTLQPSWLDEKEADCFAETVAALTVRDSLINHARFMAGARWTCTAVMLAEFPAMYHAAAVLLD